MQPESARSGRPAYALIDWIKNDPAVPSAERNPNHLNDGTTLNALDFAQDVLSVWNASLWRTGYEASQTDAL
jgi:hypothetical protein